MSEYISPACDKSGLDWNTELSWDSAFGFLVKNDMRKLVAYNTPDIPDFRFAIVWKRNTLTALATTISPGKRDGCGYPSSDSGDKLLKAAIFFNTSFWKKRKDESC